MPWLIGQIAGGAVAVLFLSLIASFLLGKISSLPRPKRLVIGLAVAPVLAAVVWSFGSGDGSWPYFAQGFLLYCTSAFWVFVAAAFMGKVSQ